MVRAVRVWAVLGVAITGATKVSRLVERGGGLACQVITFC